MTHALLKSRVFRCSDEALNVNWGDWSPTQMIEQYPDTRHLAAYHRDKLRGFGILGRKEEQPDAGRIGACKDILSRFACLPGTSFYFSGGCHAGEEEHGRIYRGEKTKDFTDYHLEVLSLLGTLVYHPAFAYAPDLESHGQYDIEQKKAVQSEFVAAVRQKYPDLAIILTAGGFGNPEDILKYGSMPAEGCMLRWCMYVEFSITHAYVRKFKSPVPYPLKQSDADRLKQDITKPDEAWKKEELQNAVGFNRASIRAIFKQMKATGLPLLCQEAGFHRMDASAVPFAKAWRADVWGGAWAEGMSMFDFSMGKLGGSGGAFHLGVGLDPSDARNQQGRAVAGLN